MGILATLDKNVERKLMGMHCAYIGKVISFSKEQGTAKVQPLGLTKRPGDDKPALQPVVDNVPVLCGCKVLEHFDALVKDASSGIEVEKRIVLGRDIRAGDLVACICADRNISAAVRGRSELPPAGRHSISDSIVVAALHGGEEARP